MSRADRSRHLRVRLRPSRILLLFQLFLHLLAVLAPWFSALPVWLCLLIGCAIAVSLWSCLLRFQSESKQGVARELRLDGEQWSLVTAGESRALRARGSFFVSPWLLVLNFGPLGGGKPFSLVLPPDGADRDELRRLRVALRYGLSLEDSAGEPG